MDGSAEAQLRVDTQCVRQDDVVVDIEKIGAVCITSLPEDAQEATKAILQQRMARGNILHTSVNAAKCESAHDNRLAKEDSWSQKLAKSLPIISWLPGVSWSSFRADLIAGITVGVMVIPQSMSYANIAGLDYIYGMYSACVPTFVYALFGQSRQLAVGPVAMVSLLTEAGLNSAVECDQEPASTYCKETYTSHAILTSLVVGVMQLLACMLQLGFVVSFLGHPVVSGFTSGAVIIIGLSQLKYLFGYDIPNGHHVYDPIIDLAEGIDQLSWVTLLLGVVWIAYLMINKKLAQKYRKRLGWLQPLGPLISCAVGILLIFICKPLRDDLDVAYVGDIPSGIFPISVSDWKLENLGKVMPTAISVTLIGYMESIAIGKNLAARNGYELDPGQELLALGMANLAGAAFSCYPVTGSFSRSAVNNQTGAVSQLSGLVTSIIMLLTLLLLTPLFHYLPKFALAAIVINSVIPLVAYQEARRLFNVKQTDFLLWLTAFLGTLFLGVLLGIAIAVGLSLVIVISESVRPQIVVLWRIPGTSIYRNMKQETNGAFVPNIFIVRVGSSLYFANASFVKDTLITHVNDLKHVNPIEYVVLEMTAVVSIDSTAAHVIHDIVMEFRERGIKVAFAMVGKRVEATMDKAKLREEIGEHWFFHTVDDAVQYCVRRQHAVRQHKMEDAAHTNDMDVSNAKMPESAAVGDEFGISNDMNPSATCVFMSFRASVPNITGNVVACFHWCGVVVLRAQVDPFGDTGSKHTYWVGNLATNKKLKEDEVETLHGKLEELMRSVTATEDQNAPPAFLPSVVSDEQRNVATSVV